MAGMAVSVMDSENIIYTGYYGFADMENNVAVDDETLFLVVSVIVV
jgi:CubicO group peptidase (beta-lactamase class C family)